MGRQIQYHGLSASVSRWAVLAHKSGMSSPPSSHFGKIFSASETSYPQQQRHFVFLYIDQDSMYGKIERLMAPDSTNNRPLP
jgi:hypothetical protein